MRTEISCWRSMAVGGLLCAALGCWAAAAGGESNGVACSPNVPADRRYLDGWRMPSANPERTGWVPEEVRGQLKPLWFKPIAPYIPQKVQVIAADGLLYVATARGLFALDAETGDERWVYATQMPLGHSPTVVDGVAYVRCLDRRIHAIDAKTGRRIWISDPAGAGFHANPLILTEAGSEPRVYAGNRDGVLYCLDARTGRLVWKFETGGMVVFSPAAKEGVIYFASDDAHAYAVKSGDGQLVWKSQKLPGGGFHSWWPVVYRDWVIYAGNNNYGHTLLGRSLNNSLDADDVYPNRKTDPSGTLLGPLGKEPGDWVAGTPTLDAARITEYYEQKPWRRRFFVLERKTGKEYTFDFDKDGKPEYAPILWHGSHSGNRYPPIVGGDGVLYQTNSYFSNQWIPGGNVTGWKIGTPFLSVPCCRWIAVDEPMGYSAGGNCIYWHHWGDRGFGSFDVTVPNAQFPKQRDGSREWEHVCYNLGLQVWPFVAARSRLMPGFDVMYGPVRYTAFYGARLKGVYGLCGEQTAPVPYREKVYYHACNSVLAFGPKGQATGKALPIFKAVPAPVAPVQALLTENLKAKLAREVEKMLAAGHLRPGHMPTGLLDGPMRRMGEGELADYWHNPADTVWTLVRALPLLSPELQEKTKAYLQKEFEAYPPYCYAHVGWKDGAPREIFDFPPELAELCAKSPPRPRVYLWSAKAWGLPPHNLYSIWKYAEVFGGAKELFEAARPILGKDLPRDEVLIAEPELHNMFIAGLVGYLNLEKLAGSPPTPGLRAELDRLLKLRADTFTTFVPIPQKKEPNGVDASEMVYTQAFNAARNFMYLVPELADYLRLHALEKVRSAMAEYERVAPYWFVAKLEENCYEGATQHLYDRHSLFQAKAMILREASGELAKYLDVPAFARGDLFYIQNLVSLLGGGER